MLNKKIINQINFFFFTFLQINFEWVIWQYISCRINVKTLQIINSAVGKNQEGTDTNVNILQDTPHSPTG